MSPDPTSPTAPRRKLDKLVFEYFQAIEQGRTVDRSSWIRSNPEIADELREFFEGQEHIDQLGQAFHGESSQTLKKEDPYAPTPTRPYSAARPAERPERLGDYEILEEIGQGGMGVIYKAKHISLNRLVAIKMILGGRGATPDDRRRFRAEAEAAALLDHPNIVPIFEVGEWEDRPFLCLKLIEGSTLAREIALFKGHPRLAAKLMAQVARAVQYAHERGILHRDLKPGNILLGVDSRQHPVDSSVAKANADHCLLTTDYCPFVTDFGLAKRLGQDSSLTQTGEILGTPSFMAPEQAAGARTLTTAADIFSLGTILFEMMTGQRAFACETPMATILKVQNDEPDHPRSIDSSIPADLETICLKCLRKDPKDRYPSAGVLAEDLERWLAGEPILARPATLQEKLRKWIKRRPAVAAMSAALAVVSISAVVLVTWKWLEADRLAHSEAHARAAAETSQQNERALRFQAEQALAQAQINYYSSQIGLASKEWDSNNVLRARGALLECPQQERNWEWHYLQRLFDVSRKSLPDVASMLTLIRYSPDGRSVLTVESDGNVRLFDVATRRPIRVFREEEKRPFNALFHRDGKHVLAVFEHHASLWNIEDGKEVARWKGSSFVAAPDGSLLAFGEDRDTCVVETASNKEKCKIPGVKPVAISPNGLYLVGGKDAGLALIELDGGKQIVNEKPMPQLVEFSRDSRLLASVYLESVIVRESATGKEVANIPLTASRVQFSPDGQQIACIEGKSIALFDLTSKKIQVLQGHSELVTCLDWSQIGNRLATGGFDNAVRIWDTETGNQTAFVRGHTVYVRSISFRPDGKQVASAAEDGLAMLSNVEGEEATIYRAEDIVQGVTFPRLAVLPDSDGIVFPSRDGLMVWRLKDGKPIRTLRHGDTLFHNPVLSPDGRLLIASSGKKIAAWSVRSGDLVKSWTIEGYARQAFASSDPTFVGLLVLNVRRDKSQFWTTEVLDWESGKIVKQMPGGIGTLSPDGRWLATIDGTDIQLWQPRSSEAPRALQGHGLNPGVAQFSPDGRFLVTMGGGNLGGRAEMIMWDVDSGKVVWRNNNIAGVMAACFSPDGSRLVTAGGQAMKPGEVQIWDARSGRELLSLRAHRFSVRQVGFSAMGAHLITVSDDGTLRVWNGAPAD